MDFTISGLSPEPFAPLFDLSDADLAARGAKRVVVGEPNAVPCRVSLEDAAVGEEAMLFPYRHLLLFRLPGGAEAPHGCALWFSRRS